MRNAFFFFAAAVTAAATAAAATAGGVEIWRVAPGVPREVLPSAPGAVEEVRGELRDGWYRAVRFETVGAAARFAWERAVEAGPALESRIDEETEAEWTLAREGIALRLTRVGALVFEAAGAETTVAEAARRFRRVARASGVGDAFLREAVGASRPFFEVEVPPLADRIRVWVYGRAAEEVELTEVRVRTSDGRVRRFAPEAFRVVFGRNRIDLVAEGILTPDELRRSYLAVTGRTGRDARLSGERPNPRFFSLDRSRPYKTNLPKGLGRPVSPTKTHSYSPGGRWGGRYRAIDST